METSTPQPNAPQTAPQAPASAYRGPRTIVASPGDMRGAAVALDGLLNDRPEIPADVQILLGSLKAVLVALPVGASVTLTALPPYRVPSGEAPLR